jgi:hypothetical protein
VRVQWTGEQVPPTEVAYRLMAEQLPTASRQWRRRS